jgi:hypothetical protein
MKKELFGAWRLVEFELRDPGGNVIRPFGEDGIGLCMIDRSGYLSGQLMRCDRPQFASDSPTAEEIRVAYSGYLAYFGKLEINEEKGTLVTHVEGCLNPDWVGTDQLRYFEFSGDYLVLRTPPMQVGGVEFTGTFTWEKVGGKECKDS